MPPHYDKGGAIPHFDTGGGLIPGQGFDLTQNSGIPNLDQNLFSGDPMTLTKGSSLPTAKATPTPQPSAMQQASQMVGLAGGLNGLGAGRALSGLMPSIGGIGGETESISPALAAADPDLVASGAGTTGLFSSIGPMLDSIGTGLGSLFSFLGPAAPALAAVNRGGAIHGYSRGGLIRHYDDGGLVPSDTSTNPMANQMSSQFAGMSTQQLQQVLPRIQNPQQKMLAQRVLQQKQVMPNAGGAQSNAAPMAPTAPQAGMARGGLIKRYADAGSVDNNSGTYSPDYSSLLGSGDTSVADAPIISNSDLTTNPAPNPAPDTGGSVHLSSDDDNTDVTVPSRGLVSPNATTAPAASAGLVQPNTPVSGPITAETMPYPTFHDDKPTNEVNPWLSVAAGVAGALSGKSPYILQNLAGGALTGLESYSAQNKEAADEAYKNGSLQDARNQMMREVDQHNADAKQAAEIANAKIEQEKAALAQTDKYHQQELQKPELVKDMMGVPTGWATPGSNKVTPLTGMPDMGTGTLPVTGGSGNPASAPATGIGSGSAGQRLNSKLMTSPAPDADIDAYLAKYPAAVATHAEKIASGEEQWPTGFATKNPILMQAATVASQINPGITQAAYPTFLNYANGQKGNTARSLNVATAHLDTLDTLTNALDNGDTQAINSLSNTFKSQFGVAAPTNFNTAKQIVADEVTKAVIGAGGTGADREAAAKVINAANSPAQLHEAISTYRTLMAGQLTGLQQQYEAATGRNDFQSRILTPQARAALNPQSAVAATTAPTLDALKAEKARRMQSQQQQPANP